jgi:hypothetical protein
VVFNGSQTVVGYTRELYLRDRRDTAVAEWHTSAMGSLPASLAKVLTPITIPSPVIQGTDDPLVPVDHAKPSQA